MNIFVRFYTFCTNKMYRQICREYKFRAKICKLCKKYKYPTLVSVLFVKDSGYTVGESKSPLFLSNSVTLTYGDEEAVFNLLANIVERESVAIDIITDKEYDIASKVPTFEYD